MAALGQHLTAGVALACPRCEGPSTHAFEATDRNRGVTDARFAYRRCSVCGVVWLVDPPADLGRYYPSDYHVFLRGEALAAAAANEVPRLQLVTRHVESGRLVEIGPSQGVFAFAARQAGFEVVALEMDASCCAHLEAEVGVQAIQTAEPDQVVRGLAPSRAVVLWHVIEHLEDAWPLVREIAANLERGGVLALATPNPQSLQFKLFGRRWVHLDAPRHVTLIPLRALAEEAARCGLRLVGATTTDRIGRELNHLGWERSPIRPPALLREPGRVGHFTGRAVTVGMRPWESRRLNGAAYTAVFQKTG